MPGSHVEKGSTGWKNEIELAERQLLHNNNIENVYFFFGEAREKVTLTT